VAEIPGEETPLREAGLRGYDQPVHVAVLAGKVPKARTHNRPRGKKSKIAKV
jgi:hypothetical protein